QLATHIAAKTTRLRVGTAVIVVPLHHPLVVAEEIATLDLLAGGRVDIGLGRGYQHYEFERLGLELESGRARWDEAVDRILTALQKSSRPSRCRWACNAPSTSPTTTPTRAKPPSRRAGTCA